MTVAAVVSTKGGPGKTTVGANLGAFCADAGIRILPIDLDNQPSLSSFMRYRMRCLKGSTTTSMRARALLAFPVVWRRCARSQAAFKMLI
ncbi:ParA family protein [Pseudomonas petroselini]|uniref:ParA family protein n=1 Tax=Pseudomonas petroselini TaxID=2899822 RepID=UPI003CC58828